MDFLDRIELINQGSWRGPVSRFISSFQLARMPQSAILLNDIGVKAMCVKGR